MLVEGLNDQSRDPERREWMELKLYAKNKEL